MYSSLSLSLYAWVPSLMGTPSPPGKHTQNFETVRLDRVLELLAREGLGTRWAKYPCSPCRT